MVQLGRRTTGFPVLCLFFLYFFIFFAHGLIPRETPVRHFSRLGEREVLGSRPSIGQRQRVGGLSITKLFIFLSPALLEKLEYLILNYLCPPHSDFQFE